MCCKGRAEPRLLSQPPSHEMHVSSSSYDTHVFLSQNHVFFLNRHPMRCMYPPPHMTHMSFCLRTTSSFSTAIPYDTHTHVSSSSYDTHVFLSQNHVFFLNRHLMLSSRLQACLVQLSTTNEHVFSSTERVVLFSRRV